MSVPDLLELAERSSRFKGFCLLSVIDGRYGFVTISETSSSSKVLSGDFACKLKSFYATRIREIIKTISEILADLKKEKEKELANYL